MHKRCGRSSKTINIFYDKRSKGTLVSPACILWSYTTFTNKITFRPKTSR